MARAAVGRRQRGQQQQRRWQARADADGQGSRAGDDSNDGRRGQMLTGKGREPVRRQRQARGH